ncbi:MAG: hypothetical protein AAFP19_05055 [Bacteroidota bacterium]
MSKELEQATAELYQTFSQYPSRPKIEGCPCCVSDADKATLHSKPLQALEDSDLSYYAFKAMTTFGDLDDFKHYLPRIFELLAKRQLSVDVFVILGKLEYGHWDTWEEAEKSSIHQFLKAWWKYDVNHFEYFDTEILIEIYKISKDLGAMLNDWNLADDTQGFKNYVQLIEYHYHDLKNKNSTFRSFPPKEVALFLSWIKANAYRLEEAFFKYADRDQAFSEKISSTLYLFERI